MHVDDAARRTLDHLTGASAVVTVDVPVAGSPAVDADTGALAVGEYAYYLEVTHPSAAAANREVQIQHRDSGNAANIGLYGTFAAGSGKRIKRGKFTVETANERQKLMYRVKLAIDPKLLETYRDYVKAGLTGNAYAQVMPNAAWPAWLSVRLPDVAR